MALGLTVVLQIGLLGRAIDDSRREWWSRLGAFVAIYTIAALVVGLTSVCGPVLLDTLFTTGRKWIGSSLTVGGIATTVSGLLAARSKNTNGNGNNTSSEILARTAPYVFIAGLLIIVSAGLHWAVTTYSNFMNTEPLNTDT